MLDDFVFLIGFKIANKCLQKQDFRDTLSCCVTKGRCDTEKCKAGTGCSAARRRRVSVSLGPFS